MATQKSTQAAPAASVNESALDPYMRPESITGRALSYAGVDLPPILSGYEPGRDFEGKTLDC